MAQDFEEGEIVWVKLSNSWWPGEVCNDSEIPEGAFNSFKKRPIAVVKFFNEDSFEYVKNLNNIFKYNCNKKNEFIKKGLELYRSNNKFAEKFPSDVQSAELKTGGNIDIIDSEEFSSNSTQKRTSIVKMIFGNSTPTQGKSVVTAFHNDGRSGSGNNKKSSVKNIFLKGASTVIIKDIKPKTPQQIIQSSPQQLSATPNGSYKCHLCSFTTQRQNLIIIHSKTHKQAPSSAHMQTITLLSSSEKSQSNKSSSSSVIIIDDDSESETRVPTITTKNEVSPKSILTNRNTFNKDDKQSSPASSSSSSSSQVTLPDILTNTSEKDVLKRPIRQPPKKQIAQRLPLAAPSIDKVKEITILLEDWSDSDDLVKDSTPKHSDHKLTKRSSDEAIKISSPSISDMDLNFCKEQQQQQQQPKIRNIPKKDRRPIIMEEFNTVETKNRSLDLESKMDKSSHQLENSDNLNNMEATNVIENSNYHDGGKKNITSVSATNDINEKKSISGISVEVNNKEKNQLERIENVCDKSVGKKRKQNDKKANKPQIQSETTDKFERTRLKNSTGTNNKSKASSTEKNIAEKNIHHSEEQNEKNKKSLKNTEIDASEHLLDKSKFLIKEDTVNEDICQTSIEKNEKILENIEIFFEKIDDSSENIDNLFEETKKSSNELNKKLVYENQSDAIKKISKITKKGQKKLKRTNKNYAPEIDNENSDQFDNKKFEEKTDNRNTEKSRSFKLDNSIVPHISRKDVNINKTPETGHEFSAMGEETFTKTRTTRSKNKKNELEKTKSDSSTQESENFEQQHVKKEKSIVQLVGSQKLEKSFEVLVKNEIKDVFIKESPKHATRSRNSKSSKEKSIATELLAAATKDNKKKVDTEVIEIKSENTEEVDDKKLLQAEYENIKTVKELVSSDNIRASRRRKLVVSSVTEVRSSSPTNKGKETEIKEPPLSEDDSIRKKRKEVSKDIEKSISQRNTRNRKGKLNVDLIEPKPQSTLDSSLLKICKSETRVVIENLVLPIKATKETPKLNTSFEKDQQAMQGNKIRNIHTQLMLEVVEEEIESPAMSPLIKTNLKVELSEKTQESNEMNKEYLPEVTKKNLPEETKENKNTEKSVQSNLASLDTVKNENEARTSPKFQKKETSKHSKSLTMDEMKSPVLTNDLITENLKAPELKKRLRDSSKKNKEPLTHQSTFLPIKSKEFKLDLTEEVGTSKAVLEIQPSDLANKNESTESEIKPKSKPSAQNEYNLEKESVMLVKKSNEPNSESNSTEITGLVGEETDTVKSSYGGCRRDKSPGRNSKKDYKITKSNDRDSVEDIETRKREIPKIIIRSPGKHSKENPKIISRIKDSKSSESNTEELVVIKEQLQEKESEEQIHIQGKDIKCESTIKVSKKNKKTKELEKIKETPIIKKEILSKIMTLKKSPADRSINKLLTKANDRQIEGSSASAPEFAVFEYRDDDSEHDIELIPTINELKQKYCSPDKLKLIEDDLKSFKKHECEKTLLDNSETTTENPGVLLVEKQIQKETAKELPIKERGKRFFKSRNRSMEIALNQLASFSELSYESSLLTSELKAETKSTISEKTENKEDITGDISSNNEEITQHSEISDTTNLIKNIDPSLETEQLSVTDKTLAAEPSLVTGKKLELFSYPLSQNSNSDSYSETEPQSSKSNFEIDKTKSQSSPEKKLNLKDQPKPYISPKHSVVKTITQHRRRTSHIKYTKTREKKSTETEGSLLNTDYIPNVVQQDTSDKEDIEKAIKLDEIKHHKKDVISAFEPSDTSDLTKTDSIFSTKHSPNIYSEKRGDEKESGENFCAEPSDKKLSAMKQDLLVQVPSTSKVSSIEESQDIQILQLEQETLVNPGGATDSNQNKNSLTIKVDAKKNEKEVCHKVEKNVEVTPNEVSIENCLNIPDSSNNKIDITKKNVITKEIKNVATDNKVKNEKVDKQSTEDCKGNLQKKHSKRSCSTEDAFCSEQILKSDKLNFLDRCVKLNKDTDVHPSGENLKKSANEKKQLCPIEIENKDANPNKFEGGLKTSSSYQTIETLSKELRSPSCSDLKMKTEEILKEEISVEGEIETQDIFGSLPQVEIDPLLKTSKLIKNLPKFEKKKKESQENKIKGKSFVDADADYVTKELGDNCSQNQDKISHISEQKTTVTSVTPAETTADIRSFRRRKVVNKPSPDNEFLESSLENDCITPCFKETSPIKEAKQLTQQKSTTMQLSSTLSKLKDNSKTDLDIVKAADQIANLQKSPSITTSIALTEKQQPQIVEKVRITVDSEHPLTAQIANILSGESMNTDSIAAKKRKQTIEEEIPTFVINKSTSPTFDSSSPVPPKLQKLNQQKPFPIDISGDNSDFASSVDNSKQSQVLATNQQHLIIDDISSEIMPLILASSSTSNLVENVQFILTPSVDQTSIIPSSLPSPQPSHQLIQQQQPQVVQQIQHQQAPKKGRGRPRKNPESTLVSHQQASTQMRLPETSENSSQTYNKGKFNSPVDTKGNRLVIVNYGSSKAKAEDILKQQSGTNVINTETVMQAPNNEHQIITDNNEIVITSKNYSLQQTSNPNVAVQSSSNFGHQSFYQEKSKIQTTQKKPVQQKLHQKQHQQRSRKRKIEETIAETKQSKQQQQQSTPLHQGTPVSLDPVPGPTVIVPDDELQTDSIMAIQAVHCGVRGSLYYLCSPDKDGQYKRIDNQLLYLDRKTNQLVPATLSQEHQEQNLIITSDDSSSSNNIVCMEINEQQQEVENSEVSNLLEEQPQNQQIVITVDGQQLIIDYQDFLTLAAGGNQSQLVTADGQTFVISPEFLQALGTFSSSSPDEATLTQQEECELNDQATLIDDVLQIENSADALIQHTQAQTNETNALLTQPPIMSTLETPSKKKSSKAQVSNYESGDVLTPQNYNDCIAFISTSRSGPSSLELPITVTNPAIAPKLNSTNLYNTKVLLPSQMSPNAQLTLTASSEQDLHELFTSSANDPQQQQQKTTSTNIERNSTSLESNELNDFSNQSVGINFDDR